MSWCEQWACRVFGGTARGPAVLLLISAQPQHLTGREQRARPQPGACMHRCAVCGGVLHTPGCPGVTMLQGVAAPPSGLFAASGAGLWVARGTALCCPGQADCLHVEQCSCEQFGTCLAAPAATISSMGPCCLSAAISWMWCREGAQCATQWVRVIAACMLFVACQCEDG